MDEQTEQVLRHIGVGLRSIDDPFFEDSHRTCKIFRRKGITVEDEEELCHKVIKEFPCYISGCKAIFRSLLDFELHYNTNHRYVCIECKKPLPNPRLLDIHIQETHDCFFQVQSTKEPTYQCYVSECDLKFNNAIERRNHCISVHHFPKNFRFDNVSRYANKTPKEKMDIDESEHKTRETKSKRVALNRNQKNKMFTAVTKTTVPTNVSSSKKESDTPKALTGTSLSFIPRQVQKSYTRILTKNESGERDVLETDSIMDLVKSLPE